MQIQLATCGDVAVVKVPGDSLEAHNAEEFKRQIADRLGPGTKLLIDLSRLTFVDSSGLSALLSCHKQAQRAGGAVKLCGLAQHVRSLFEMVGMDEVLSIHGTRDEAIVAFERG